MRITKQNIDKVFKSQARDIDVIEGMGYEWIESLLCDNSGFGSPDEPAYTPEQLKRKLTELVNEHDTVHTFIVDVGQFQVNLGVFKRGGEKTIKRIANNTYLKTYPDGKRGVILHETEILREVEGGLIVDNGGWATLTTHDRLSRYTGRRFHSVNRTTCLDGEPVQLGKVIEGLELTL